MAGRIAIWTNVPHGSQLLISVTGTTATSLVTAHAFVLRDDGLEQTFPDNLLQPGPLIVGLDAPHTYSVLTDLIFGTSGTATVTARVVDRNNLPVPPENAQAPEFHEPLTGSEGQTLGLTFFIITART